MTYDLNAVTSFADLYRTADALSSGLYVGLGTFAVFIIAMLTMYARGNPAPSSAAAAAFISTIAAVFLWVSGVVSATLVGVHFAMFIAATLWNYLA